MAFDLQSVLAEHRGRNYDLHTDHVTPQFTRVLRTIGLDRVCDRGHGAWPWDIQGRKYLDMLAGCPVHNAGRNHPVIRKALEDWRASEGAGIVQLDAPLLAGLVARELTTRTGLDGASETWHERDDEATSNGCGTVTKTNR